MCANDPCNGKAKNERHHNADSSDGRRVIGRTLTHRTLSKIILGLKCHNTWDGQTAGYECEKPERMFVLQSGGERGQFGPYKLHQFDLEEKHGKATRSRLLTVTSYFIAYNNVWSLT